MAVSSARASERALATRVSSQDMVAAWAGLKDWWRELEETIESQPENAQEWRTRLRNLDGVTNKAMYGG